MLKPKFFYSTFLHIMLLLLFSFSAFATHNRAGEITYRKIGTYRYEVKIVTYTKTSAPADRPQLELWWGDGQRDTLNRISIELNIGPDIQRNTYIGQHDYPGNGTYIMYFLDENRNAGVINIGGSVNIPFYVETELIISPYVVINNSPQLLQPPIDNGAVNRIFIHNPNAYDPDGDSLSYELAPCKGSNGLPIPTYSIPAASNSFTLNAITGDLIWDTPQAIGEYNVAMIIREWRNIPGVGMTNIGYVTRDMQIRIYPPSNDPPQITVIADTCVEAGTTLDINISATDPNAGETVTLSAIGGPFSVAASPATFTSSPAVGTATGNFNWVTECSHVHKQPYSVVFKAVDNNQNVQLADLEQYFITVVAPSPKNPAASPFGNSLKLNWNQSICQQAAGYKIFRRVGQYGFTPSHCETGVPAYTGYQQIATVNGVGTTNFTDDNNGQGLTTAVTYCYMVDAYFADGAESYASVEFCSKLKRDIPVMTNVDINTTSSSNGEIYVAWGKPTELDTAQTPGPYRYVLQRAADNNAFSDIATFNNLNDTTYNDSLLNASDSRYRYKVALWNDTPGNTFLAGTSQAASSIYLTISPTDEKNILSWNVNVPWLNHYFNIYKEITPGVYSMIDTTSLTVYTDDSLINGQNYCYYIESVGAYNDSGLVNPIINKSQIACATPIDNVPPCSVSLTQKAYCEQQTDTISWNGPDSCSADIKEYLLYFSPENNGSYQQVAVIPAGTLSYVYINPVSITGCYYVVSKDSVGNESKPSSPVCVESCPVYELPNVFTPDNNGINDEFHPFLPYRDVSKVDMIIYNRWGSPVYDTTNPYIGWNGRVNNTGGELPDGVYFYICSVYEVSLQSTPPPRILKGTISLYRGDIIK